MSPAPGTIRCGRTHGPGVPGPRTDRSSSATDRRPVESEGRSHVGGEERQEPFHTGASTHGERPEHRAAEPDRPRAQGQCDEDVTPAPDPAVVVHLGPLADSGHDLGQRVEGRGGSIELASTMVRHDHSPRSVVDSPPSIVGGKDPFDDDGQLCHALQPIDDLPGLVRRRGSR